MPERLECEVLQKARYINTLHLLLGKTKFAQLMPPTHLSSCSVYVAWLYYLLCMALSFEHTHRQIDRQIDRQTDTQTDSALFMLRPVYSDPTQLDVELSCVAIDTSQLNCRRRSAMQLTQLGHDVQN